VKYRNVAQNLTLAQLIQEAFNVQAFQISGGPAWIYELRCDLEAKPPADSKAARTHPSNFKLPMNDDQREMLQTLLAARFQLKYRKETRQQPVYLLVKGNKRLKLDPAKDQNDYPWVGGVNGGQKAGAVTGAGIAGINASMQLLALRLSRYMERPV
jgi:uncharacterized protein (TIGR03435 family)